MIQLQIVFEDKLLLFLHPHFQDLQLEEIETMIADMYEEKMLGRLSEDNFYSEMEHLIKEQNHRHKQQEKLQKQKNTIEKKFLDIKKWKKLIRRCIDFQTIDRATIEELIEYIEAGEREVIDGVKHQDIKIVYKFVGCLDA